MKLGIHELSRIAGGTSFPVDVVEKAIHLLNLLNRINSHPALAGKIALKG